MSAPVAAEVLRELGARTRTFRSVRQAMLWYRDELARRLQCTRQGFEPSGAPRSAEAQAETHATFAAIAQCLRANGLGITPDGRSRGQRAWGDGESLCWLLAWYENGADDGTQIAGDAIRVAGASELALEAGLTRRVFHRRCQCVQAEISARLADVGLLVFPREI